MGPQGVPQRMQINIGQGPPPMMGGINIAQGHPPMMGGFNMGQGPPPMMGGIRLGPRIVRTPHQPAPRSESGTQTAGKPGFGARIHKTS